MDYKRGICLTFVVLFVDPTNAEITLVTCRSPSVDHCGYVALHIDTFNSAMVGYMAATPCSEVLSSTIWQVPVLCGAM